MNVSVILMARKGFVPAHLSLPTSDTHNKLWLNEYRKKLNIFLFFSLPVRVYSSLHYE